MVESCPDIQVHSTTSYIRRYFAAPTAPAPQRRSPHVLIRLECKVHIVRREGAPVVSHGSGVGDGTRPPQSALDVAILQATEPRRQTVALFFCTASLAVCSAHPPHPLPPASGPLISAWPAQPLSAPHSHHIVPTRPAQQGFSPAPAPAPATRSPAQFKTTLAAKAPASPTRCLALLWKHFPPSLSPYLLSSALAQ